MQKLRDALFIKAQALNHTGLAKLAMFLDGYKEAAEAPVVENMNLESLVTNLAIVLYGLPPEAHNSVLSEHKEALVFLLMAKS